MAPFLNRQRRQSFSSGGGTGSYLGYALGEIILVTIGILIALYIKDWHSDQQQQKAIYRAARVVMQDLQSDTTAISMLQSQYSPQKKYFKELMLGSMTRDSLRQCEVCPYLITSISPFKPTDNGYLLLQKFEVGLQTPRDSLIHQTKLFYKRNNEMLEVINGFLREDVSQTLSHWKQNHVWYSRWVNGEISDAMLQYMLEDPIYKNRVATHYLLVYENYLAALKAYKQGATKLASRWQKVLPPHD